MTASRGIAFYADLVPIDSRLSTFRLGLFFVWVCSTPARTSRRRREPQGPEGRCWTNLEGGNRGPGRRPRRRNVAMAIVVGVRASRVDARPVSGPRGTAMHSAACVDALRGRQAGQARRGITASLHGSAPPYASEAPRCQRRCEAMPGKPSCACVRGSAGCRREGCSRTRSAWPWRANSLASSGRLPAKRALPRKRFSEYRMASGPR